MVLAIAALLFQFGSVPAVPAAAAASAAATTKAAAAKPAPSPAPTVPNLPDAPLPSNESANTLPSSDGSGSSLSQTSHQPAALRVAALSASANDNQTLSTIHIPEANSKALQRVSVEEVPSRRKWLALSIAQSSAAGFDAYATRRALQNGATEADPFMRPFAGSSGIYAAIQVCPIVLDYTARHMQRSENPVIRHTWWLPQTLGAGLYLFSGAHDLQVAGHR